MNVFQPKGVIYQYVDFPAEPSVEIIEAYHDISETVEKPVEVTPFISPNISVPNTIIDREIVRKQVVEPSELTRAYHNTAQAFRHMRLSKAFRGFFIGGIIGLLVLFSPLAWVEARYRVNRLLPQKEEKMQVEIPKIQSPSFSNLVNQKYLSILKPVDQKFAVIIPKLAINSRVIAEVDTANKAEYSKALKLGAAHAKGTYLPGENGTIYIFAHSTDAVWNISQFNAIFYLLRELEENDQVHLVYNGKVYPYIVTDKKVVDPDSIEYLTPHHGREELILQTCWPPGTTSKRLLIFARPSDDIPRKPLVSYSP